MVLWDSPGLKGVLWLARGSDGLLWVWRGLGIVTLPILVWGGSQFYRGLWSAAKSTSANMHTLIGVGIAAAWLYSTVAVIWPGRVRLRAGPVLSGGCPGGNQGRVT